MKYSTYTLTSKITLIIFFSGLLLLIFKDLSKINELQIKAPEFSLFIPASQFWFNGFIHGVIIQAPLTILNSVVAICALSASYFPKKGIKPQRMALISDTPSEPSGLEGFYRRNVVDKTPIFYLPAAILRYHMRNQCF